MTIPKSKIKIIHDGKLGTQGSKVVDAETGESIPWVQRVEVILDPREAPRAHIYTIAPELDMTVEAEITPYERQMAERIADAVMQRLQHERTALIGARERLNEYEREQIALDVEQRLQRRLESYIAAIEALHLPKE